MRFRRAPHPTPFEETARKRAAFLRKQRLEREALQLVSEQISAKQHGVDEEMSRCAHQWAQSEQVSRDHRAPAGARLGVGYSLLRSRCVPNARRG
jgi:hypothetical protein